MIPAASLPARCHTGILRLCLAGLLCLFAMASGRAMDVVVAGRASAPVTNAGATVTFTLHVTNLGPGSVSQVVLTNQLSARTTFLSAATTQGSCTNNAGRVTCTAGTLAAGGQFSVSLQVRAAPGTNACLSTVAAAETDPVPANNTARVTTVGTQTLAPFLNTDFILLDFLDPTPGSIYPSVLRVSGVTGMVHKVTVSLNTVSHSNPDDLDILLVAPDGRNVMLMSDCGLDGRFTDITITLDDEAAVALPDSVPAITTGTYRPANYGSVSLETLEPPAPPKPWGATLSVFQGANPNGDWQLFVYDDSPEDGGSIADGWTLQIVTSEPIADLALAQAVAPNPVPAGSNVTWLVTVTNLSGATIPATLVDALPPGVTFLGATATQGSCSQDAGVVTCALGTLAPGASAQVSLALRANQVGALTNTAMVSGTVLDPVATNNTASSVLTVLPVADLDLAAAAPATVLLREPLSLVFALTNRGPQSVGSVLLTNVLPDGFELLSSTPSQGTCALLDGSVRCELGTLGPGAAAVITLSGRAQSLGTMTHLAGVTAAGFDPIPTNNASLLVTDVLPAADLQLSMAPAPATMLFGEEWSRTLLLTNHGPSGALVTVTSTLPAALSFLSAVPSQGSCSATGGVVTCQLGLLPANQAASITLLARSQALGTVTNLHGLVSSLADPVPTNNSATNVVTILPSTDLALSAVAPTAPVWLGTDTTITFILTNRGPNTANGVTFISELPPSLNLVSSSASQGSCVVTGKTVTCQLGLLEVGQSPSVTLLLRPLVPGQLGLSGRVSGGATDPDLANNLATLSIRAITPAGAFAGGPIVFPESGPASPYPSLVQVSGLTAAVYRVRVTLTNLAHTYPDDLDLLLVGPGGQSCLLLSDAGGRYPVTNLNLTFDADVSQRLPDNAALVSSMVGPTDYEPGDGFPAPAPPGPYAADLGVFHGTNPNGVWSLHGVDDAAKDAGSLGGWSLAVATWDPIADLQLGQRLSTNLVAVGSNLFITLTVTNVGPAAATDVHLTQTLDPSLSVLFATGSQGSCSNDAGTLRCALGTLPAGAQALVQIGLVPQSAAVFTQSASVTAAQIDLQPANNAAQSVLESGEAPVITQQPLGLTVINGDPAVLSAAVTGSLPLFLQWERNGLEVPGATNETFALTAAGGADRGTYRLRVANRFGLTRSEAALLRVVGPPVIEGLTDQVIDEDTATATLSFTIGDQDSPPETLVLSAVISNPAVVAPAGVVFGGSGALRTVQVTPRPDAFGESIVGVVVTDVDGLSATNTFLLTVRPINDPPTLSPIANQSTAEDTPVAVSFLAGDAESEPDSLAYAVTSSDPDLLPASQMVLAGEGTNRTLTLTPGTNRHGAVTVTLTAQDTSNSITSVSFVLTVAPVNDPPTLDPVADRTVLEDSGPHLVPLTGLTAGAPDEVQVLRVSARSSDPARIPDPVVSYTPPAATAELRFQPVTNASGPVVITVTVADGGTSNATIIRSFTVEVTPVNDPPALTLPASVVMSEDEVLSIPTGVSDPDDDPGTAGLVVFVADPALLDAGGVVAGGSGNQRSLALAPRLNAHGSAVIRVVATDVRGAASTNAFTLTVLPVDDPPTLDPLPDRAVNQGAPAQGVPLTGISAGAPNEFQPLTVTATSSNPALVPPPVVSYVSPSTTGTLTFQPSLGSTGTAVIAVSVSDGAGVVTRPFTVTVGGTATSLFITPVTARQTAEDTPVSVPFTIGGGQTPVSLLTLSATSSNPTLIDAADIRFDGNGSQRTARLVPRLNQSGTASVTFAVSDGLATVSTTFALSVSAVNDPPTLDFIPAAVFNTSKGNPVYTLTVTGISSGAPNEAQTLTVTAVSGNTALLPNPGVSYQGGTTATLALRPAGNTAGSVPVTVTVNDGAASSNTVSRTFTVYFKAATNAPPFFTGLGNVSTPEDTPAVLPFTVGDSQTAANLLVLSASSANPVLLPPGSLVPGGTGAARTLQINPATNQSGTAAVTLTLLDDAFGATNVTFTVTVTPVNDPPQLSPIPNQTGLQGQTLMVPFSVADVETPAGALAVEAVSDNPTLLPPTGLLPGGSGTNRALQIFPASGQTGSARVTLRVSDGTATVSNAFLLTINPAVGPPTLSPIPPITTAENTPVGPIEFIVGDNETPSDDLAVTAESSNPALIPTTAIALGGTGAVRTLSFTPAPNAHGSALLTLTVTDSSGLSSRTTIPVTVTAVNDPPTLDPLADLRLNENDGPILVPLTGLSAGATEPDQYLSLAASADTNLLALLAVEYPGTGPTASLWLQPIPGLAGSVRITVTADDGQASNHLAARTFTLHINAAPRLADIPDQFTFVETPTVPIPLQLADADSSPKEFSLRVDCSNSLVPPGGIVVGGVGARRTLVLTPATNQAGTATITVTATDAAGASSSNRFQLTVASRNVPPTLDPISDRLVNPGSGPLQITLTGITPGDPSEPEVVSLTAVSSDPGRFAVLALDHAPGASSATLTLLPVGHAGAALISVTADDGRTVSNLTTRTFTATINTPPNLSPLTNQVALEDTPSDPQPFTVTDAEHPAASLTVSATASSGSLFLTGSGPTRTLSLLGATNASGMVTVTVVATDPLGLSATNAFTVQVEPVPDPILILAQPQPVDAALGGTATFQVTATSVLPLEYQWRHGGLDLPGATNASLTLSNLLAAQAGSYTVRVRNTDDVVELSQPAELRLDPRPRITALIRDGSEASIFVLTFPGSSNILEFASPLAATNWIPLLGVTATNDVLQLADPGASNAFRFYRVRRD